MQRYRHPARTNRRTCGPPCKTASLAAPRALAGHGHCGCGHSQLPSSQAQVASSTASAESPPCMLSSTRICRHIGCCRSQHCTTQNRIHHHSLTNGLACGPSRNSLPSCMQLLQDVLASLKFFIQLPCLTVNWLALRHRCKRRQCRVPAVHAVPSSPNCQACIVLV